MTYEYTCTACGHYWEATQSIKDAPLETCPSCEARSAKRLVSGGTGFVLKGSGWYADLYSSSKPTSQASDSSDTKSEGKSASKPAAESKSAESTTAESKPAATTSTPASKSAD